jgi:hypothetical protein
VHASLDTLTLLEVPGRKWKATSAEQGEHVAALFADEPDPFTQLTEHQLVEILRQLATTRGLAATTRSGNTSQLRRHLAGQ